MSYVYAKLMRTGLCNKLFPWAQAVEYAHETGATMIAPKWVDLMRIGPWLRHERDKRYYFNEFTNVGYVSNWLGTRAKLGGTKVFSGMEGFFDSFLDNQPLVKAELRRIINSRLVDAVDKLRKEPFVGVHVRRGDFVTGGIGISDEWYIKAIGKARELVGDLPVKIFSDGDPQKLIGITAAVKDSIMMPTAPAIQDLLLLSHSKVLVATSRSTFSMWAVYLGQMPSIWSDVDLPPKMYVDQDKTILLEGMEL